MRLFSQAWVFAIPPVVLASFLWAQQRSTEAPPARQRINELNDQARQLDSVDTLAGKKRHVDANGQWQMDKIVKEQYDQLTADTEKLNKLTAELKTELNNPNVLSAGSMKKAEEIERLAKKVRSRLRGWF
jgi:parvulin-like peptidyl-prolyl isomerase